MATGGDRRYTSDIKSRIFFPSLGGEAAVFQAEVLRADRAMDSATIEVYPPKNSEHWISRLETGTPVMFTWKTQRRTGVFTGYLHTINTADSQRLLLTCVGMGYPLHLNRARARADSSSRQVIADICTDNYLEFSTNPKGLQRWNIAQGPSSDWSWLLAVTLREGLSLHFRGATLLAQPLDHVRSQNFRTSVDVVIPPSGFDRVTSSSQSPVRRFTNKASTLVAGAVAQTQNVYGMVTANGQLANVVTPGSVPVGRVTLDPVSSPLEAQSTLSARDIQERWTNHATIEMDGVPGLHPLDLVRTALYETKKISAVWSVLSVKHVITSNDYTVVCDLGEETTGARELMNRPVGQMSPTYRLHRQAIGGTEWYTTPVLRLKDGKPGQPQNSQWHWTAEQVMTR